MAELHEVSGLPVAWTAAKPFVGNTDPNKLLISWVVNSALLATEVGLFLWLVLSYASPAPGPRHIRSRTDGTGATTSWLHASSLCGQRLTSPALP